MSRAKLFPCSLFLFVGILITCSSRCIAQGDPNLGAEAGRRLAAQLRSMQPAQNEEWHGHLKIQGRDEKIKPIPVVCRSTTGTNSWTVTYEISATETAPAEKLVVTFSTNSPNKYLYARAPKPGAALGELKELKGAEADIPLAGSDFWLSDLGLEFFSWPDQNRLQGEKRSTRPAWVLESTNPHPTPSGYSWVKTWVDQEAGKPLAADAFGPAPEKRKLKQFIVGSVRKNPDGHYELKNIEMMNLKTNSRTFIEFDVDKD